MPSHIFPSASIAIPNPSGWSYLGQTCPWYEYYLSSIIILSMYPILSFLDGNFYNNPCLAKFS